MLQVIDISGIDPVYYDIDVVAHGKGDIGDKPKVTLPVGARDGELKGLEDVETRHGELSSILDAVRRATRRVYLPEQGFVPAWPGPDEF